MWFPWYINTTKGTIMNKIRRWVLIHLISHYVLGVVCITVWIVDTRWNICIFPFTYYYMPRGRSVLSNCICFVYFITYSLLGHSQGPKGYHYYYNCDNNCSKTKPGQEGWYFKISTFLAAFQEQCDFLDIQHISWNISGQFYIFSYVSHINAGKV